MDRFSVSLPVTGEDRDDVFEFEADDVQVMLSWLEHDVGSRDTSIYRNGEQTACLRRLGRESNSYWMIIPS